MKTITGAAIGAVAALYANAASAAVSHCLKDSVDLCFQWAVPEASASSGSGNIYFQIEASSSMQWVGLGIGSGMTGAEMFLIYQDGSGNVTLSTRSSRGHSMPQYSQRDDVELLAGSGVDGDKMVANIRCSGCDSLDLTGSNSWIAAYKSGSSLDSTNLNQNIREHDDKGVFAVNFAQASISSDSNPFVEGGSSSSGSGRTGSGGAVTTVEENDTLVYAHGIVMSVVFLLGYPIGAVLMPLLGSWMAHAGWQVLAFLGMWAGFGIGYHLADKGGYWFNDPHVQLGTIVCALMTLQPILGYVHHVQYLKHQKRTVVSHAHIWYGRILMILGIVNGGLGLRLADAPKSFIIAYSVVAAIVFVIYGSGSAFGAMKRSRQSHREKTMYSPVTHERRDV